MTEEQTNQTLTQEELDKYAIAKIDEDLKKLEEDYKAITEQEPPADETWSQAMERMGKKAEAESNYYTEKERLEKIKAEIEGPSEHIKSYINDKKRTEADDLAALENTRQLVRERNSGRDRLKGKSLF